MIRFVLTLVLLAAGAPLHAQLYGGARDAAFGTAGATFTSVSTLSGPNEGAALLPQPDGKVIVAGTVPNGISQTGFFFTRYLASGAVDAAFGTGGQSIHAPGTSADRMAGAVLEPSGRIAAVGTSRQLGFDLIAFVTLSPAGVVETQRLFSASASVNHSVVGLARDTQGRFLILARANAGYFLLRVLPTGEPDTGFGASGFAAIAGSNFTLAAITVDLLDRVVVAGWSFSGVAKRQFHVARFLVSGAPDTGFGTGGSASIAFSGTRDDEATALRVDALNRIHVAGYATNASLRKSVGLARLTRTGALDPTFGSGGLALRDAAGGDEFVPAALAVGREGFSFVLSRHVAGASGQAGFAITRFTAAGSADSTFAPAGDTVFEAESAGGTPRSIAVAADGRLLVSGDVGQGGQFFGSFTTYAYVGEGTADLDGDGIPNAVEASEGRNYRQRDNDVLASARLFAMQQYRDFLNREGDAPGIASWTAFIDGGGARVTMVEGFFASGEFQGGISPVARLYFAYFLRIPDYAGLQFWIDRYRTGTPLAAISQAFAASGEFTSRYGALDNGQFVNLVYQNVLKRAPDAEGLAFWVGQLNGGLSRGEMMIGFSESAEFAAASRASVNVTMTYIGMLRRSPDTGGYDFWVGYLNGGNSQQALISGFLASAEYAARFTSGTPVAPVFRIADQGATAVSESAATAGPVPVAFAVTLDRAGHPGALTVVVNACEAAAGCTAVHGQDYTLEAGFAGAGPFTRTLAFAAGETHQVVTVNAINDTVLDGAKTFTLALSQPASPALADGTVATLALADDDIAGLVGFTGAAYSVSEDVASGIGTLTVSRSTSGTAGSVQVEIVASGTTGLVGVHYGIGSPGTVFTGNPPTATLDFAVGQGSVTVPIAIVNNPVDEASKTVRFRLKNPAGLTIGTQEATLTILNVSLASNEFDINGTPIPAPTGPAGATMCDRNPGPTTYPGSGPGPCGSYQVPLGNCSSGMTGPNAITSAFLYILEDMLPGSPRLGNSIRLGVPRTTAMIFRFRTGPAGAFQPDFASLGYRNITVGYDEQVSRGPAAPHFATISETKCDFDYGKTLVNGSLNGCYVTMSSAGSVLAKVWPSASVPTPAADFPFCPLKPDTVYYLNIRYEDASLVNTRGLLSCPAGVCGAAIGFN